MGNRVWPPTVDDLKADQTVTVTADDAVLGTCLDAAIAHFEDVRGGEINFTGDILDCNPAPTDTQWLGVLRQAARWADRRRSADGIIVAGDLGTTRVPSFDPDIERMLGLGRYRGPVFG
jgi:hypothetical protein